MSATKVAVIGAGGRMGATVCRALEDARDLELVGRFDMGDELGDLAGADVVVEFSVPDASDEPGQRLRGDGDDDDADQPGEEHPDERDRAEHPRRTVARCRAQRPVGDEHDEAPEGADEAEHARGDEHRPCVVGSGRREDPGQHAEHDAQHGGSGAGPPAHAGGIPGGAVVHRR